MATPSTPPSPSPSPSPSTLSLSLLSDSPPIPFGVYFIIMLLFIATLINMQKTCRLFVSRRRRPLLRSYSSPNFNSPASSPNFNIPASSPNFNTAASSPNFNTPALTDAVIKTIPLSIYTRESNAQGCAMCLLQFEENDSVRTLPVCYHAYHDDCIDIWLRLSATCPLCRAEILRPESP